MADLNLPVGTIIYWQNATIPPNWQVCDGTNGTPNLIDHFVQGAANDQDVGVSETRTTHSHTTTATNSRAAHNHGGTANQTISGGGSIDNNEGAPGDSVASPSHSHGNSTVNISNSNAHTHTIGASGSTSSFPRHILRVFIQKIT